MKNYDTTVARIAGNIAAGVMSTDDGRHADLIVAQAVDMAYRIVAEVRRRDHLPRNPSATYSAGAVP